MGFGKRLRRVVKKATAPVVNVAKPVTDPVSSAFTPVTKPVVSAVESAGKPVESAFTKATDSDTIKSAGGAIGDAASSAAGAVKTGASQTWNEYDRYTSSKTGAYLTPYLSMYDSDGRMALREAYGNYAAAGAGAVNPAAGAVASGALAAYDAHNAPDGASGGGGGGAFAPPQSPGDVMQTPSDTGFPWWVIPVGIVAALGLGLTVYAVAKGRK